MSTLGLKISNFGLSLLLAGLISVGGSISARADVPQGLTSGKISGDINPKSKDNSPKHPPDAGVGFYSYSYLYAPNSGRNTNFFSLTGFFRGQHTGSILQAKGDFEGVAIVKPATTWTVEAPEAYIGTSPSLSKTVSVKVGRELRNWSHLDQDFQLGIWEPRFRWDYVHPQRVGLAGLYVDVKTPEFQLTAFGSPIFIPDRGIPVEVRDNELYAVDNFFNAPASTLPFRGVPTHVSYDLSKPSLGQMMAHPGGAIMARVGKQKGLWASAAYAFKPMNQLLFSYTGLYDMALSQQQIDATLYPRVAYHQLLSAETGYEGSWYGFSLSGLEDRPVDSSPALGENEQMVTLSRAISPAMEFRFGDLKYSPTVIRIAALKQWGGNAPDSGPLASGSGSLFENRYFSNTAGVISAQSPLRFLLPYLSASYRLLVDAEHLGTIQSTDFYYVLQRDFLVNLGADFLDSREDPSATDPISEYRANDRVRLGVSYVF